MYPRRIFSGVRFCPESEEALREMYRAIHRGERTAECTVRLQDKDSERKWFAHLACTTIF